MFRGQLSLDILIPTYNRSELLALTLESVQKQLGPVDKIIIVDDASTDNTQEVISEWMRRDSRIFTHRNNINSGESKSINVAWELSKSRYVAILSSDDPQPINWIDEMSKFISMHPGYIIYYPNRRRWGSNYEKYEELLDWSEDALFVELNCIASVGAIIDRDLLPKDFLPRDEEVDIPSDLIQLFRLASIGKGLRHPSFYADWHEHSDSKTFKHVTKMDVVNYQTNILQWMVREKPEFVTSKFYAFLIANSWGMQRNRNPLTKLMNIFLSYSTVRRQLIKPETIFFLGLIGFRKFCRLLASKIYFT